MLVLPMTDKNAKQVMTCKQPLKPVFDAVIFDMDGLMLDTEFLTFTKHQQVAKALGYDLDLDMYRKTIGTSHAGTKAIYADLIDRNFPYEAMEAQSAVLIEDHIKSYGVEKKKGLVDLLTYLKTQGRPMAVATSTYRDKAVKLLQQAGIIDFFTFIVCGDQVTHSKPQPDIYLKAAQGLGLAPHRCLVFEDSKAGVLAAFRAGMQAIIVPDLIEVDDQIKGQVVAVVASLADALAMLKE